MSKLGKIRVLIADDDRQLTRRLADFLTENGFEVKTLENGREAKAIISEWHPRFVLVDLMLPEGNAFEILEHVRGSNKVGKSSFTDVIVISGHNLKTNVEKSLELGATDYVVKPFRYEDILQRLVFHCRKIRILREINPTQSGGIDEGSLLLHLTDLVLRTANAKDNTPEKLFNLTRMVALKLNSVRCSIIRVFDHERGAVVTSHDDRKASGITLDLNKYPEVIHVFNTRSLVAVENINTSAELKSIKDHVKTIMFNSLIACPIYQDRRFFGVLSLRLPAEKDRLSDNEIRFVEIVSHSMSLILSTRNSIEIGEFWNPIKIAQ